MPSRRSARSMRSRSLDRDGNPTGMTRLTATGKGGLKGYLKWAAIHRANAFIPQLGRIMPMQINVKTEPKTVIRYATVAVWLVALDHAAG
jgi:hypothetical protein